MTHNLQIRACIKVNPQYTQSNLQINRTTLYLKISLAQTASTVYIRLLQKGYIITKSKEEESATISSPTKHFKQLKPRGFHFKKNLHLEVISFEARKWHIKMATMKGRMRGPSPGLPDSMEVMKSTQTRIENIVFRGRHVRNIQ